MINIKWTKDAVQHLAQLPGDIQGTIVRQLSDSLINWQPPRKAKTSSGSTGYTLRTGQYRILFWMVDGKTVLISTLDETADTITVPEQHQLIMYEGKPVAVVVPYADYLALTGTMISEDKKSAITLAELEETADDNQVFPHEIVASAIKGDTLIKAWREHLGLSFEEVAKRMKISLEAYNRLESKKQQPRIGDLCNVAKALGIRAGQLFLS